MPSPISNESSGLDIFRYQDHEVRTINIDGEPWFVLTDLCMALGLTNSSVVASRLDEAALSQAYISSGGQRRNVTVVSEAGMYEVVIRSDKPHAVHFRRWITSDVIPSIRKTGSYGQPDISTPAGVLVMAEQFAATAKQLVVATEQLEVQKPLVQQALTYQGGTNLTTRAEFAREVIAWAQEQGYMVKQKDVFQFLAKKLGMFVRGERSDAGQATLDALRRELAVTVKGTSDTGHNFATGKLTTTGKAYAFERCTRYIEQNGTLELPVEIRAVSA